MYSPTVFSHDLQQEKTMTPRRSGMQTIDKLLSDEGINAATVMALSGTLMVMVARGDDPILLKGLVSGALSNPVPRRGVAAPEDAAVQLQAPRLRAAA
jgi:hypothetical protein